MWYYLVQMMNAHEIGQFLEESHFCEPFPHDIEFRQFESIQVVNSNHFGWVNEPKSVWCPPKQTETKLSNATVVAIWANVYLIDSLHG